MSWQINTMPKEPTKMAPNGKICCVTNYGLSFGSIWVLGHGMIIWLPSPFIRKFRSTTFEFYIRFNWWAHSIIQFECSRFKKIIACVSVSSMTPYIVYFLHSKLLQLLTSFCFHNCYPLFQFIECLTFLLKQYTQIFLV